MWIVGFLTNPEVEIEQFIPRYMPALVKRLATTDPSLMQQLIAGQLKSTSRWPKCRGALSDVLLKYHKRQNNSSQFFSLTR